MDRRFGLKVVNIKPLEGVAIQKVSGGYEVTVVYELENGETVEYQEFDTKKRDLKSFVDSLPAHPTYVTHVKLYPNGRIDSVTTSGLWRDAQ